MVPLVHRAALSFEHSDREPLRHQQWIIEDCWVEGETSVLQHFQFKDQVLSHIHIQRRTVVS